MRHSVYVVFALLLLTALTACKPTVPKEFIQPGDLEDILYDYHVGQAMAMEERGPHADLERTKYFLAVLKKYGLTQAEFDSSMVYYYSHLDRLKPIYLDVNQRLADEAKSLGASVGDIGRYSQYSATGDTANIWKNATDILLMPRPTMNRFDFSVEVDTSFHQGDSFMFQFMSEYIWQSGSKDAVVCIVTKYEGDSIIQTANHVSASGISQVRVPANREQKLKEVRGFIYLNGGTDEDQSTRKLMFISQIQLIRFHHKDIKNETKKDSIQKNSLQPVTDIRRSEFGPASRGVEQRRGDEVLPAPEGDSKHRMDTRSNPAVKTRRR